MSSTIPDADIPAPLGEDEREDITARSVLQRLLLPNLKDGHLKDRLAGRRRRQRLREMKDLVMSGGSTDLPQWTVSF